MDRPTDLIRNAPPRFSPSYVLFGLILVGLGLILLGDRMNWPGFGWNVPVWPFIVLTVGATRLTERRLDARGRLRRNRTAGWLMFIGVWGLLNEYRLFGLHYPHSWPLLVIGVGAMIVWQALDPLTCTPTTRTESHS